MALEMKVYREVQAYEAKVMFGRSWRQLGALALGVPLATAGFATIAFALHSTGSTWENATNLAMWVIFPVLIPVAAWGWWRPKGLKPERYIRYVIRHYVNGKVIRYDDTYRANESVSDDRITVEPAKQTRRARRAVNRQARKWRKMVPQEHVRTPRRGRRAARSKKA